MSEKCQEFHYKSGKCQGKNPCHEKLLLWVALVFLCYHYEVIVIEYELDSLII